MERIGERERKYVSEVLDTQFRSSAGSNMTGRLEKAFAERIGVKYAIAHINGTATMHSALAAAGVGPGDEVIVPALTMASTSLVVLHANAVPVFADIEPEHIQCRSFRYSAKDNTLYQGYYSCCTLRPFPRHGCDHGDCQGTRAYCHRG